MTNTQGVYEELGVKRIINAAGNLTMLGGSILAPQVRAAMEAANESFVEMEELLDKSGQAIADLLGVEAALVTSGCFAALVQGAAGIMTGKDLEKIARLPDTTGMKDEFLIQKRMRYHYDRCASVPGSRLIEVGDEQGTTAGQLEAAIGTSTAGILYLARAEGAEGTLTLSEVVSIARDRGVAVLVDAAAEIYPPERMMKLARSADLVGFGGKYFGSLNSAGLLCGRRDLVEAAALNGFVAYEVEDNRCLGRGYKVDRQEVIATFVALREWLTMDHEERFRIQEERLQVISDGLADLPHVKTQRVGGGQRAWMGLRVILDEAALGKTAISVEQALRAGDPCIWMRAHGDGLFVAVSPLKDGEEKVIVERLQELLSLSKQEEHT